MGDENIAEKAWGLRLLDSGDVVKVFLEEGDG
jgi:hypothetical protein